MAVEIRGSGEVWWVVHNGARIGLPKQSYTKACVAAKAFEKRQTRSTRPCMCCGHQFPSQGRHHRLCAECRQTAAQMMV